MAGPGRAKASAEATGGRAIVSIFDGRRALFPNPSKVLITARDGNQVVRSREFHNSSSVQFAGLPLFGNFGDDYAFIASAPNCKDAGFFPVKLAANVNRVIDLMLIPKSNAFSFARATWQALADTRASFKTLFAVGAPTDDAAGKRFGDIQESQRGEILACMLNILTAMQQIQLPQRTPFDYLLGIVWDRNGPLQLAPDRFFAWADPSLIDQVEQAKLQTPRKFENAPFGLHPGATRSYKQVEFGEANLQLTFHENERMEIDGVNCVLVEPDIDYFKDVTAHLLLEVAVNALGNITDPRAVYALRWIAGRRAGMPEFDPLYTIERA